MTLSNGEPTNQQQIIAIMNGETTPQQKIDSLIKILPKAVQEGGEALDELIGGISGTKHLATGEEVSRNEHLATRPNPITKLTYDSDIIKGLPNTTDKKILLRIYKAIEGMGPKGGHATRARASQSSSARIPS